MPMFMSDANKDKAATIIIKKMRGSDEYHDMRQSNESMMENRAPSDTSKVALIATFEEIAEAISSGDRQKGVEALKSFIQMIQDGSEY